MSAAFTASEVAAVLGLPAPESERTFDSVSTDSRKLQAGALFVALHGENGEGVDYLEDALRAGAAGAVVPAGVELPSLPLEYFRVEDTKHALGELAAAYRRRCGARVVAITGSSGKTTVKEMIRHAIGTSRQVHATRGTENNQIGVPISILAAPLEAEFWVLELGSSEPGEIARLTEIAAPDDAVVTTIGPAHLEGLGDESGVLREKLALVEGTDASGTIVVGERPSSLPEAARRIRPDTVVAGLEETADYAPERHESHATHVWFDRGRVRYRIEAGGEHHLRDALIAAALAEAVGIDPPEVARGLAEFRPLGMRGAVRQLGTLTVVADCYNANPESFEAAIDYCTRSFPGRSLAAVVGTMLELGDHSGPAHREVARSLTDAGFSTVAASGEFSRAFKELGSATNGTRVISSPDPEDSWDALRQALSGDEVVLVKGSRGVKLERIVEKLAGHFGSED